MKSSGEIKISYWAAHFTTIMSVTMVLLLVGIIAMITLGSENETRRLKERLEVSIIMSDSISDARTKEIYNDLSQLPFALEPGFITKEQALKDWQAETGEDLEELFGVNPLSPEIYFRIKSDYSNPDSLKNIGTELRAIPGVAEVAMPDSDMVEAMNSNIRSLAIILGVVALIMVIISFILINNTVHLAIYSRRFTIHTMQLVGATDSFIKRPFVLNNILAGLLAALCAAGITAISLATTSNLVWNDLADYISWGLYSCVSGGMLVAGPAICGLAAWMATTKYLGKDYEELFN